MILAFILQGEFAMSEFGDFEDLMFGMMLFLVSWWLVLVIVCSRGMTICNSLVNEAGMFTGSRAIRGYATSPTHTIA